MKESKIESSSEPSSKNVPNFPVKDLLERERQQHTNGAVHSNLQNALRKKIDIAEIMVATATYENSNIQYQSIQKLVTYPLKRKIYFEIIAHLETELQIFDEEELYVFIEYVKTEIDKLDIDSLNIEIETQTTNKTNEIMARLQSGDASPEIQEYRVMYDKMIANFNNRNFIISEKFKRENGISTDDEAIQKLTQMAIFDMIYQKEQNFAIRRHITPHINNIIDVAIVQNREFVVTKKEGTTIETEIIHMKRLSVHSGNERQTYMLAGAPACGKGTILAKILTKAMEEHRIHPSDIVKINTDTHRALVSAGLDLGEDKKMHVSLNNDESSYITSLAYEKMAEKIAQNSAPHLLIDGVSPAQDRIALGLASDGNLDITVVTLNVDESLNRAYSRGEKIGRFVQTDYLIQSHKTVSKSVIGLINNKNFQGKSMQVTLYDNNGVAFDEEPYLVATIDLENCVADVQDPARLMDFHDKMYGGEEPAIKDQLTILKSSGDSSKQRVQNMFEKSGIAYTISSSNLNDNKT